MRPDDLQYSQEHEWVRREDADVVVGITDFASQELGDIVFIELPEAGTKVEAGSPMGTIETVKAVEELYAPVGGIIAEVNLMLQDKPELVNEDPFGEGWFVRIAEPDLEQAELMDAAGYADMIGEGD